MYTFDVATAGLVDEWLLYIAPKLLGEGAKPLASLARLTKLEAAPLASFGQIRSTITSARQMQLGIRVMF